MRGCMLPLSLSFSLNVMKEKKAPSLENGMRDVLPAPEEEDRALDRKPLPSPSLKDEK